MRIITRRGLITAAPVLAASAAVAETLVTEDGLHRQSWFLQSFLDLAEDLEEATAEGKRFAVMFEQRGCPYCRDTHLINFAVPEVAEYIRARFAILQINLNGDLETTDFDGSALTERRLAERYGVRFTPTVLFFPDSAEGLGPRRPREREILRVQGYQEPGAFRRSFEYVAERVYETGESLPDYLARSG